MRGITGVPGERMSAKEVMATREDSRPGLAAAARAGRERASPRPLRPGLKKNTPHPGPFAVER